MDVAVAVNPINDLPVAIGDPSAFTSEDTPLPLLLNGSDIDGGPLTFIIVTGPVEANSNALAAAFVVRPEFVAKYGGLNNTLYVQELFNTTGIAGQLRSRRWLMG